MQLTSDNYILGIKEARSFLNNNPDLTREEMGLEIQASARLMRQFSQPMKDVFKGQRDFWKNQLKKGKQNACDL